MGHAASVRVYTFPELHAKGDVSDYLDAHDVSDLLARIDALAPLRAGADSAAPEGPAVWPDIIPLDTADLLPFPVYALGTDLAPFVTSLSVGLQTPADLAGTLTLGAISAACGGRYHVQPEAGWNELVTIHTACFLPSGNRKSAVVRAISRPFEVEQATRAVSERADRARWETRRKIDEKAHQRLIDKAGDKGDQTIALLAEESAIRLAADRPPKSRGTWLTT